MTPEDRADMLNEIQKVVEKYDYDVAGYADDVNNDGMFEILLDKK